VKSRIKVLFRLHLLGQVGFNRLRAFYRTPVRLVEKNWPGKFLVISKVEKYNKSGCSYQPDAGPT